MNTSLPPTTEIAGYRLAGRIGSGGMGDVYKALHPGLNRLAAIKILHQKEMAERFKNEAYIQSSVSHPAIARLYEYIVAGDKPCIIMEYVEGRSLDALLQEKHKLSSEETEKIIRQIAAALAYLHRKDILHRDIKPQNFRIQSDGTVKMLDFGISKHKYSPRLTQQGFVVGTTEYMAPEQFEEKVEKKSDIWSLGVMTYELLTGFMPFEATNPLSLRAKIAKASFTNPRILVPDISPALLKVIERSLCIHPAQRASAAEIESLLSGPKQQPTVFQAGRLQKITGKKLILPAALFGAALLVIIMVATQPSVEPVYDDTIPSPPAGNLAGNEIKTKIAVPGVPGARIVFPDGQTKSIPFEIKGKEGDYVEFILQAEGYAEKKAGIALTIRRSSYEYNLDKIKH